MDDRYTSYFLGTSIRKILWLRITLLLKERHTTFILQFFLISQYRKE